MHTLDLFLLFFFNDTATTEIYTLSLHDALPISLPASSGRGRLLVGDRGGGRLGGRGLAVLGEAGDRKSTRLNSSHLVISYAVFCLKKKKRTTPTPHPRRYPTRIRLQPGAS